MVFCLFVFCKPRLNIPGGRYLFNLFLEISPTFWWYRHSYIYSNALPFLFRLSECHCFIISSTCLLYSLYIQLNGLHAFLAPFRYNLHRLPFLLPPWPWLFQKLVLGNTLNQEKLPFPLPRSCRYHLWSQIMN